MVVERRGEYGPDGSAPVGVVVETIPDDLPPGAVGVIDDDGGMTFGPVEIECVCEPGHGDNLADLIDEHDLEALASDLVSAVDADLMSRSDWDERYRDGVNLLGLTKGGSGEVPFDGASEVVFPMMMEAIVQFQARALVELFPPTGPVRTEVVGEVTPERQEQAERVADYMNHVLRADVDGFFESVDQMLMYLPLAGCVFRKVYYDSARGSVCDDFIMPEDLVVNYTATSIRTAPRVTHILHLSRGDMRRMQATGFYRDVPVCAPSGGSGSDLSDLRDEVDGRSRVLADGDEQHVVYEIHADLCVPGIDDDANGVPSPYVVTIDRDSKVVLAVRRNWADGDATKSRRRFFVKHGFLPGLGFYNFGLAHTIGTLAKASTSILRQLIDAGTLANIPGGFKARGMNVRDSDSPILPGEWRDVDAPGMDLSKGLLPLPYRGADQTLLALLGTVIDAGRRMASIADMQVGDVNAQAPVGSTIALLEAGGRVMSGIHLRLHQSLGEEFRLLAGVMAENLPGEYPYDVPGAARSVFRADFDGRVDVIPVSDPRVSSKTQRIALAQTRLQMAQSAPQIHDMRAAYAEMYRAIGIDGVDAVMPPPESAMTGDVASENAAILLGKAVKPSAEQNHAAHIAGHSAFLQMLEGEGGGGAASSAVQSHITEHVAMGYLVQVAAATGVPYALLTSGQRLPPEIEAGITMSAAHATQAIASRAESARQAGAPAAPVDPALVLAQVEAAKVEQRREEAQADAILREAEIRLDAAKVAGEQAIDAAELGRKTRADVSKARLDAAKLAASTIETATRGLR